MIRATVCNQPRSRLPALTLVVAALILFGPVASADLLVTRDGSQIETKGAWKVQGRLVVFQMPDGQLASLQLGEVDLEASRAATEENKATPERPPATAPPERKAVLVLTDDDIPRAERAADATAGSATGEARAAEAAADSERLVVSSWQETGESDGVVITGELMNQSAAVATNIQLGVLFYDREGEVLETVLATLTSEVLQPGQRARFRADVRDLFDYSSLRFEAESLGLEVGSGEEGPEETPGGEGSTSSEP